MPRRAFIGGNWKSNGTVASINELVTKLNAGGVPDIVEAVVAPTFLHLDLVKRTLSGKYEVAAQNSSATGPGAYTGEVTASQLKDFGITWVILGHSERRALYGATDAIVAKQIALALQHGVRVIACVGETIQERKANQTWAVVERQLNAIATVVTTPAQWQSVVIAYEPVWAIGTGETATPKQAQEVHALIRQWLVAKFGAIADSTRVIYGGSVKGSNAEELFREKDIDGFLVGGASLQADDWSKILVAPTKVPSKL